MIFVVYNTTTGYIRMRGMNTPRGVELTRESLPEGEELLEGVDADPRTQMIQIVEGVPTVVPKE